MSPFCLTDTAGARPWRFALAGLPPARWPESMPYGEALTRVHVVSDSAVCRQARAAAWKLGGADTTEQSTLPAQAYVFDVAAVKYVVVVPGDRAGEWQMSYWFGRDWTPDSLVLGL